MQSSEPAFFLLDDSLTLQAMISLMAKRFGWSLLSARSVEDAQKMCGRDNFFVRAAMIDLMIPQKNAFLKDIDALIAKGDVLRGEITRRGATAEERLEKELRLDAIDAQLQQLVDDEGGISFLSSEEGQKLCNFPVIKIAIFSSRRPDFVLTGKTIDLQTCVSNAVGRPADEWFEKPVPPVDLEEWLVNQLGRI